VACDLSAYKSSRVSSVNVDSNDGKSATFVAAWNLLFIYITFLKREGKEHHHSFTDTAVLFLSKKTTPTKTKDDDEKEKEKEKDKRVTRSSSLTCPGTPVWP